MSGTVAAAVEPQLLADCIQMPLQPSPVDEECRNSPPPDTCPLVVTIADVCWSDRIVKSILKNCML